MILRAELVVPISGPPIRDGYVAVDGTRITGVGPRADAPAAITHDLGPAVLLPGLINPHTHLELTCYHGQLAPGPFWSWVLELVGHRQQEGAAQREATGLLHGAWESLRAGVTTVGDISRRGDAWQVLQDTPLRAVCFAELLSFAAEPARTPDELRELVGQVPTNGRLQPGASPHATYSVRPQDVGPALQQSLPWTIHVAETEEEIGFLAGQRTLPPGLLALADKVGITPSPGPLHAYLQEVLPTDSPGSLVHMNYLTDADIRWLSEQQHVVIYCPRAHRFFGHPPHPLPRLLQAGVPVALGTDSKASNESLSILGEAACVAETFPGLCSPEALLEMVTRNAARALARPDLGILEAGQPADMVAFPLEAGLEELLRDQPEPLAVWIDGQSLDLSSDASPVNSRSD